MHTQLIEGVAKDFETSENDSVLMKVRLKDRAPPLTLIIKYQDDRIRDLTLFTSPDLREPNSLKNNGAHSSVSS